MLISIAALSSFLTPGDLDFPELNPLTALVLAMMLLVRVVFAVASSSKLLDEERSSSSVIDCSPRMLAGYFPESLPKCINLGQYQSSCTASRNCRRGPFCLMPCLSILIVRMQYDFITFRALSSADSPKGDRVSYRRSHAKYFCT